MSHSENRVKLIVEPIHSWAVERVRNNLLHNSRLCLYCV